MIPSSRRFRGRLPGGLVAALALGVGALGSVAGAAEAPPIDPAALMAALEQTQLDESRPLAVAGLRFNADLASLHFERGVLWPTSAVAGRSVEFVFVGEGRVEAEAPDAIEAGQLELFTGARRLERDFTRAVFVLASEAAGRVISRRAAATPSAAEVDRARQLWREWRAAPERKQLAVDLGLLAALVGEPGAGGFFVGWLHPAEGRPFLVSVDPSSYEQVTIGQFVPVDLTKAEERRARRLLDRQQRRGRLLGVEVAELGSWDQWLSAPLGAKQGRGYPASAAFEPVRYVLEVALSGRGDLDLEGHAKVVARAERGGCRWLEFQLHRDLAVRAVRGADGQPLFHLRRGGAIGVLLPQAPARGMDAIVEIEYAGKFLDKVTGSLYALRDTLGWYPHLGDEDRAGYDVTLRWPDRLDLVAAGRLLDSGSRYGERWERRVIDERSLGFSFEVGQFQYESTVAGRVAIEVAFDSMSEDLPKEVRQEILNTASAALLFFEETYGPYPHERLRLVTVPRLVSQSLPGFITLSSLAMADVSGFWRRLLGLEDRRTVVAHELAHQWWGHLIGWQSYRDQWLSEAMASFSAVLYGRRKLDWKERPGIGPAYGWQEELLATLPSGRSVESLGPVVLGVRLFSSHSDDAYVAIVYKKGAVVLDLLSRLWKEDDFLEVLRRLAEAARGRTLSTQAFVALIERLTGADLDDFARRFLLGTGIPEVFYDYEFGARRGESWPLSVRLRQQASYRFDYALSRRADGRLEVERRQRLEQEEAAAAFLPVPFEAEIEPEAKSGKGRGRDDERRRVAGRIGLRGANQTIELALPGEPLRFHLDPRREVFALFWDERREPKRAALRRGLDALAAGDLAAAETALRAGLAVAVRDETLAGEKEGRQRLRSEARRLDGRLRLALARTMLGRGEIRQGEEELDAARAVLDAFAEADHAEEFAVLEGRLALAKGQPGEAFRRLHKAVVRKSLADSTEAWLWLAVAAQQAGERNALKEAIDELKGRQVDLSLLGAAAAQP